MGTGSISTWIRDATRGDEEAFRKLWDRYWRRMIRTAKRKIKSIGTVETDAEDVTSIAFAQVCHRIQNLKSSQNGNRSVFWNLLRVAIFRRVVDAARGKSVAPVNLSSLSENELYSILQSQLPPDFSSSVREDLAALFEHLNEEERDIVLLSIAGNKQAEIAEKVGLSRRSVIRRLVEIRKIWNRIQ